MSKYLIDETTMSGIADAVRDMRHEKAKMTPAQIEAKIRATRLGIPITISNHINPETGKWERPAEWPDIDALAAKLSDTDECVYLTYDLRKTPGYGWIGIYVQNNTNNTPFWIERGHIEDDEFIADESHEQISINSNAATSTRYFRQALDETYGEIQLWRVRSESHIERLGFATNSTTNAECFQQNMQPCVDRAGNLPYCTNLTSTINTSANNNCMGTIWLEHDALIPSKLSNVTTLAYCWNNCFSLQSLDLSGWDTSGWAVTSLAGCWASCYSLQSLDLSEWDTSKWAVTTLAGCFNACLSLQSLDVSSWDTSKWAVTSLSSCFNECYSLQSLDLNSWDTSGWAVNTLASCWANCYSLHSLDLSNWNTSDWAVTTLYSCWFTCYSLRSLDVNSWNTSNWAVTTLYNCFNSCYSLQSLDLSSWDTSGWTVTDTRTMFNKNHALKTAILPESIGVLSSQTSNVAQHIPNTKNIEYFSGVLIYINHTYADAFKLTIESLVAILNRLPTVTAARTITLGQINKLKLTAEQIAIATQKGWTVA